jgi:hypothetical protein
VRGHVVERPLVQDLGLDLCVPLFELGDSFWEAAQAESVQVVDQLLHRADHLGQNRAVIAPLHLVQLHALAGAAEAEQRVQEGVDAADPEGVTGCRVVEDHELRDLQAVEELLALGA